MSETEKTLSKCRYGHQFFKTTAYDVCPVCETIRKEADTFLTKLPGPARMSLQRLGVTTIQNLAEHTETEINTLAGMGKTSVDKLKQSLAAAGLTFKPE